MSLAATPGGFFQLLSNPLTCHIHIKQNRVNIKHWLKLKARKPANNSYESDQEMTPECQQILQLFRMIPS
jgi:hypothetical protein